GVSDLETDSSLVNTSQPGFYVLIYTARDSSGNESTTHRTVKVSDRTAPEILLNGNDTLELDVYSLYIEQGASVSDNYCQGVLGWQVDQAPDMEQVGDYLLTYRAVDCNGNAAT